jgi:hypothetical protein
MADDAAGAPALSAILVTGARRRRSQRALNALCAQSASAAMEVVVVDIGPAESADLVAAHPRLVYLRRPGIVLWGEARSVGVAHARGAILAFVEDHCFVEPGWAEALLAAHGGRWASVGYGFKNANPDSYASRTAMIGDYGPWLDPAPHGPTRFLPGNNVSYKREALLSVGDALPAALTTDSVAHEIFRSRGLPMYIESRALAAHLNFPTVWQTAVTNYVWCRVAAAKRAEALAWGNARRVRAALLTPVVAPLARIGHIVLSLRGRRALWRTLALGLPAMVPISLAAALGEAAGYLLGVGRAERSLTDWELHIERVPGD